MKKFSKQEKLFISYINSSTGYQRNIMSMLDSHLKRTRIEINLDEKKFEFKYQVTQKPPTESELEEAIVKLENLQEKIVIAANLIGYLESEGHLIVYTPVSELDKCFEFGQGSVDMPSISLDMPDSNIVDLFLNYINKQFITTPELVELEKNKFNPQSKIQFEKQLKATWVAIIVSLIIGFSGIFINIYNYYEQQQQNAQKQILEEQFLSNVPIELHNLNNSVVNFSKKMEDITNKLDELKSKIELGLKTQAANPRHKQNMKVNSNP